MKKKYTKKQICEAIAYWKKQLKKIDESVISPNRVDFGGKISLEMALRYAMKLPSEFTLQTTFGKNRASLVPIDDMVFPSYDEMKSHSDVAIEIITHKEYSDDDGAMLERLLKKTLRQMFGVGFDVHSDEIFMVPYLDKDHNRVWYVAFLSFVG